MDEHTYYTDLLGTQTSDLSGAARALDEAAAEGFKVLQAELRFSSALSTYFRGLVDAPRSAVIHHHLSLLRFT